MRKDVARAYADGKYVYASIPSHMLRSIFYRSPCVAMKLFAQSLA